MKAERQRTVPPNPTVEPPGTRAKLAVMSARWAAGYTLNHPADARFEGDTRPLAWMKWRDERMKEAKTKVFDFIKALRK